MQDEYDIGDEVTLSVVFRDEDEEPTNPTAITLWVQTPTVPVTETAYTPVSDDDGAYHYNFTIAMSGTHRWRWKGTGAVIAADEGSFRVRKSNFTNT